LPSVTFSAVIVDIPQHCIYHHIVASFVCIIYHQIIASFVCIISVITCDNFVKRNKDKGASGDTQDTQQKLFRLKLQPMPLPKFDGSIRDYPRFKQSFQAQVVPSVAEVQQPYIL